MNKNILDDIYISIYDNVSDIYNLNSITITNYIDTIIKPEKYAKFQMQKKLINAIRLRKKLVVKFYNKKVLATSPSLLSLSKAEQNAISKLNKEIKRFKSKLIAITPGGVFGKRRENQLIKASNMLQIDIDWQDNMVSIQSITHLKEMIIALPYIAFVGLSTSGIGLWALAYINDYKHYKEHFEAIKDDFLKLDIIVDDVVSNVVSVRYYSFDSDALYNLNPEKYVKLKQGKQEKGGGKNINSTNTHDIFKQPIKDSTTHKNDIIVATLITKIRLNQIDITQGYKNWRKLALIFATNYGNKGRVLFHIISKINDNYIKVETDILYTNTLKYIINHEDRYHPSIAYFLDICNTHNIRYYK